MQPERQSGTPSLKTRSTPQGRRYAEFKNVKMGLEPALPASISFAINIMDSLHLPTLQTTVQRPQASPAGDVTMYCTTSTTRTTVHVPPGLYLHKL